jgi:hypothetical protein
MPVRPNVGLVVGTDSPLFYVVGGGSYLMRWEEEVI